MTTMETNEALAEEHALADELRETAARYRDTMGLTRDGAIRRIERLHDALLDAADKIAALRRQPVEPNLPDEQVERVARAIAETEDAFGPLGYFSNGEPMREGSWDDYDEDQHEDWRKTARAAIAALSPQPAPDVVAEIAAERKRQISDEGWTPEHDDAHHHGELAKAAACYATGANALYRVGENIRGNGTISVPLWPWDAEWWKPGTDRRRQLIKAGALIVAEIERLDRIDQALAQGEGG